MVYPTTSFLGASPECPVYGWSVGVVRERGCVLLPDGLVPCVLCARLHVCLRIFSVGGGSRRRLLSGVLVGWWVGHLVLGPAALAPSAPGVSG